MAIDAPAMLPAATAGFHTSVSLVLGSGGARGYAHIGAIEELVAQGFSIESIAGSSMGALIGGVYAAGKLDEYSDWVRSLQRFDVLRLLDWTWSGGGIIKGDRIIGVLKQLIGDINIEDLPIPYTAVAIDLDAQREVWFSRGRLFDAVRASISIPTIMRPYRYQGRLLVDGGLLNPLPVAPTLRDFTQATIAVDVNAAPESLQGHAPGEHPIGQETPQEILPSDEADAPDSEQSQRTYSKRIADFFDAYSSNHRKKHNEAAELGSLELFARSLDLVQETITRLKIAAQPPDLLISIPRNACAFYEFHRAEELIELGRTRTREALIRWSPLRRKD